MSNAMIMGQLQPSSMYLPLYNVSVPAGFPSPALDHMEKHLSLDTLLDLHASHTYPTDDSRLIIQAVQAGLKQVFREGFSYAKAQVMLLDLCRKNECTQDLFTPEQPMKTERLMSTLDAINNRWGRGTLHLGRIAKPVEWAMRRELLSPAYTTRWSELMVAKAK